MSIWDILEALIEDTPIVKEERVKLPPLVKTIFTGPILSSWVSSSTSRCVDAGAAREKVVKKARKELTSAYRTGLAEACSKAFEDLRAHGLPVAEAATPAHTAIPVGWEMAIASSFFLWTQVFGADEIEKLLDTPTNTRWQEFYQGHCASFAKQEQQLKNELKQLEDLIRQWQNFETRENNENRSETIC